MRRAILSKLCLVVDQTSAEALARPNSNPNVVLMLADNLGYGGEIRRMPAPRIDKRAGMPQAVIDAAERWIWESHPENLNPKQFVSAIGNPSMLMGTGGYRAEGVGCPAIFDTERDPRDSLKDHPNPPGFSMIDFKN